MQISVETTQGLERRLTVAVEEARIADAVQTRLKSMTKTVKMKGFRAGKVPLKVVQQQYGQQVRHEIIGDVLQSTFYEALNQEKLRPAGDPSFDTKSLEPGQGLEYTATFEIYPEVTLGSLSDQTMEKPVCDIQDADLDSMLETIRRQHLEWESVSRAAEEGDRLNIDFSGSIDGELFAGGEGKDMNVEIGSGRMIPGFESGLIGASAEDDVTLDLQFPEEYHASEVAGKPVQFKLHVNRVEASQLPPVDEAFAKKLGVESGDQAQMRSEIRSNMQRELDAKLISKLKDAVMEKLLQVNDLEIPSALVQSESQALAEQMMQNLARQGMAQKDLKMGPEMFREQAERRVKLGLIMSQIVKEHDLKVDPDKVRENVENMASAYQHPEEVVKWYYADRNRLAEVESLVFEEQVVDWVVAQTKIEEKSFNFEELMNPKPNAG